MADIKLPELGEGVTEGELVKWLVKPGDTVKADQTVAEIMTDKATVEVPTPTAGIVKELLFKPGQVIKVESVILKLDGASTPTKAVVATTTVATSTSTASFDVKLPELGEGVTEGELVKWTVNIGDAVKADQTVAEIMTDKATVEVPTPTAGVVKEFKFKKGDVIKVESIILTLSGATAKPTTASGHSNGHAPAPAMSAAPTMSVSPMGQIHPPVADSRVLATPATRRLARELNVDINVISGSGLAGRVTREDVMTKTGSASVSTKQNSGVGATSAGTPSMNFPKPAYNSTNAQLEERVDLLGIRKKIAQNMQMAKANH